MVVLRRANRGGAVRRGQRGSGLLEMVVAAGLFAVFLSGVFQFYGGQMRSLRAAEDEARAQAVARGAMEQIVSGVDVGGEPVPGLQTASVAAVEPGGLAYRAGDRLVSYYLEGGALYRAVSAWNGTLAVQRSGGVRVAGSIAAFAAAVSADTPPVVTVDLTVDWQGRTQVALRTKARLRNG